MKKYKYILLIIMALISCSGPGKVTHKKDKYLYADKMYRYGTSYILPDSMRIEYTMPTPQGMPLNLGIFRVKKWPLDKTIRVIWADGDGDIQAKTMSDWQSGIVAKLRAQGNNAFNIVVTPDPAIADMRVSFTQNNQAWTYVGTDCGYVCKAGGITMNLGWHIKYRENQGNERFGTGCHEMLHALGYIHMLQDPACNGILIWNKEFTYNYYAARGWSKEMVDAQVFTMQSAANIDSNGCDFNSIMCYEVVAGMANIVNHRNVTFTVLDDKRLIFDYGGFIPPPPPPPIGGVDLARGMAVNMSSAYGGYPGTNATDGNVNTFCHTGAEIQPWIYVDMGSATMVRNIKIYSRVDCCMGRLRNIRVWVSNAPGKAYDEPGWVYTMNGYLQPNNSISIDVPAVLGRYVRIQTDAIGGPSYLHLGSVEVYGTGTAPICKDTSIIYKVKYPIITYGERDSIVVKKVCK